MVSATSWVEGEQFNNWWPLAQCWFVVGFDLIVSTTLDKPQWVEEIPTSRDARAWLVGSIWLLSGFLACAVGAFVSGGITLGWLT